MTASAKVRRKKKKKSRNSVVSRTYSFIEFSKIKGISWSPFAVVGVFLFLSICQFYGLQWQKETFRTQKNEKWCDVVPWPFVMSIAEYIFFSRRFFFESHWSHFKNMRNIVINYYRHFNTHMQSLSVRHVSKFIHPTT